MSTNGIARWIAIVMLGAAAHGQNSPAGELAGDWKSLMEVNGTKLRLVLHVTEGKSGLAASLDSLDQGALGLPVDSIARDGKRLKFEMSKLGARFEGDWNAAALQFEGQWMQGPAAIAITWKRAPAGAARPGVPVSDEDRKYLLAYLKKTEDGLVQSIAHLSAAQWTYKADPSRWSIAECVEHLVIEERMLYQAVTQKVIQIPLPEDQPVANHEKDEKIIRYMTDRSKKVNAAESVKPHGTLATPAEGATQFSKARGETIEWVRTTQADLRGHGTANPEFGYLDAYGYWIVLSAHSARHTAQIEEVKGGEGYPK